MDPLAVLVLLVCIWFATWVTVDVLVHGAADACAKPAAAHVTSKGAEAQTSGKAKCDIRPEDVTSSDKADAAASSQLNFQTPATTIMEKIVDLHHDLMFFIIVVVVFVS